jgi:hypothetical protein
MVGFPSLFFSTKDPHIAETGQNSHKRQRNW